MSRHRFFLQLGLLTAGVFLILCLLLLFPAFQPDRYFAFGSLAFFSLLSVMLYVFATKAALSKDKNAFTRLIMGFTFVKLFLSIILVIAYFKIANPEGKIFILPFFLNYFVYTIFETIFMTRLGKIKAR